MAKTKNENESSDGATTSSTTKHVEYVGANREVKTRELTKKNFSDNGVDDQEKVSWNRENKWRIPSSDLSNAAVKFLEQQPDFKVVEG